MKRLESRVSVSCPSMKLLRPCISRGAPCYFSAWRRCKKPTVKTTHKRDESALQTDHASPPQKGEERSNCFLTNQHLHLRQRKAGEGKVPLVASVHGHNHLVFFPGWGDLRVRRRPELRAAGRRDLALGGHHAVLLPTLPHHLCPQHPHHQTGQLSNGVLQKCIFFWTGKSDSVRTPTPTWPCSQFGNPPQHICVFRLGQSTQKSLAFVSGCPGSQITTRDGSYKGECCGCGVWASSAVTRGQHTSDHYASRHQLCLSPHNAASHHS